MTVQTTIDRAPGFRHDPYASPGRITRVVELHDPHVESLLGGHVTRVCFEDGRWLEVVGASPDWPEGV